MYYVQLYSHTDNLLQLHAYCQWVELEGVIMSDLICYELCLNFMSDSLGKYCSSPFHSLCDSNQHTHVRTHACTYTHTHTHTHTLQPTAHRNFFSPSSSVS